MNGRVPISQGSSSPYQLYEESRPNVFQQEALRGVQENTPVSNLFFSQLNINALQDGIRIRVNKLSSTHAVIGRQSETELGLIMRSIYLQTSKDSNSNVITQVRGLNEKVLDYAVPIILRELSQYSTYRKDISTLPVPMERQQNVSSAGSKFLFMKDF
jgi:hypothetical protein